MTVKKNRPIVVVVSMLSLRLRNPISRFRNSSTSSRRARVVRPSRSSRANDRLRDSASVAKGDQAGVLPCMINHKM